jgi:hypothetical protein
MSLPTLVGGPDDCRGSSLRKVAEYLKHAEECRKMMAAAATDEQKNMLDAMAQTWDGLAAERVRWAAQKQRISELERSETPA